MRSGFWIAISLLLASIVSCGPGEELEQPRSLYDPEGADWVLTGGRIYTVADERPWAEAVAIKIETEKLADLVVLDENPFEMDLFDIHEIKPSAVVMEGELIHGDIP